MMIGDGCWYDFSQDIEPEGSDWVLTLVVCWRCRYNQIKQVSLESLCTEMGPQLRAIIRRSKLIVIIQTIDKRIKHALSNTPLPDNCMIPVFPIAEVMAKVNYRHSMRSMTLHGEEMAFDDFIKEGTYSEITPSSTLTEDSLKYILLCAACKRTVVLCGNVKYDCSRISLESPSADRPVLYYVCCRACADTVYPLFPIGSDTADLIASASETVKKIDKYFGGKISVSQCVFKAHCYDERLQTDVISPLYFHCEKIGLDSTMSGCKESSMPENFL